MTDTRALTLEIQDSIVNINSSFQTAATKDLLRNILDWLSAPDPSVNLATARNKRQPGTGIWLLKSSSFLNWKSEPCSLLWLDAKAGSGKTILSSTVIHDLLENKEIDSSVIYFYFDFQSREKQLVQGLFTSMVTQLNQNDQTFGVLMAFYNSHSRGKSRPTLQDLKGLIRQMIDKSGPVYIFIDALDECEERKELLESLQELRSWKQDNFHALVTSRRETDIEASLSVIATDNISLEESVIQEDILSFVRHQLQHDARLSKWPESVRDEIQSVLLEGANGMFRWVECQVDAIRSCMKLGPLRRTLKSLPKTLDDTYTRILSNIPEDYVEDARRILSCLIGAFHPLAIEEIADTVAIVADGKTFYNVEDRLSQSRDILSICSGLVTTARSIRLTHLGFQHLPIEELRLAHFSVKEYLVAERTSLAQAPNFVLDERRTHEILANLCIRYMAWCHEGRLCEDPDFLREYTVLRSERVPFAPYAASSWSRHLRAAKLDSSSPVIRQALGVLTDLAFLRDVTRLHPPWFRYKELIIMQKCGYVNQIGGNNFLVPTVDPVPPLYYASLLGMDQLVLMLLDEGGDVNSYCPYGTCLVAAVCGGYYSTVRLMLERGANVNARTIHISGDDEGIYSRTAIHEAIYGSLHEEVYGWNEELARLLLAWGADVNLGRSCLGKKGSHPEMDSPLSTAISLLNKNLIRILIDAGADLNAYSDGCRTALQRVSSKSFWSDGLEVMTMLLDAGASPNFTPDPTGLATPLYQAMYPYYPAAVRLLLERGANPPDHKAIEGIIPSMLRQSLRWEENFAHIVETLVQLSAATHLELPLIAGAKYGFAKTIDYMLQHGAAPDVRENNETTALQAAAFTPADDNEAVEILLMAGAEVNARGEPFGSALQAAAMSGKAKVVKILLEKGASVNHADGEYGTAIQIARKRLEDQNAQCPEVWKPGDRIERYGPTGYYQGACYPRDAGQLSIGEPSRNGDYEAKINLLHPANADYQAVIDLLVSHGAEEI